VSGLLNTRTFKGSGQIQLTQFRPKGLVADFFPDSDIRITGGPADFTIDLKMDEPGQLQATLNGSSSSLKFRIAKEALNIENILINAVIQVDKNLVRLSLTELTMDHPQLKLSANLALTQSTPPLSIEVKGSEIDVAATRQITLSLAGKNEEGKDIFDVVKGGRVPSITLTAQGNSLSDLGDMDNMIIQGQMQDGEIYIPDIQFDLKNAAGEVVISWGILEGQNLTAHLGNSLGQNGRLKLGLIGDVSPFHLETDVQADLSQLPPILKRLVDDKDFQRELAQITELKGNANGKLVLGEDIDNVKVKVEASDIQLSAQYGRLPHPLQIARGQFSYDEDRIGVSHLNGKLGKSAFSELSGSLGLDKKQDLAITSAKCGLPLAEIAPWLASFDKMRDISKYYGGGKSILTLSQVKLNGPLFSPAKWHFNVSGDINDLVLKNVPGRPGPTTIGSAKFKADGTFNLKGRCQGRGKAADLLKTSTGQVAFTAADGHIYHNVIMLEVLKFINTLNIFEGRANVKDMGKEGFGYHSFGVKATLQDGKLRYDEAVLHGRPMVVTAAGEHDLQTEKFNLILLVAPLVALDRIFEHIPLIGGILEALDTIPLSASGTPDNIHIRPLVPSAIGYELEEIMKKTVERPISLIHGRQKTEDR
jgi:hypothetical protein